jgi:hypothetical protein
MSDSGEFFFFFFVCTMPSAVIVCNRHLELPIWVRLAAIMNFLLSVFAIIRVYIFGVPEYRIFVF